MGDAPTISHEIGQWCVYPNFDEIEKYSGHFKARNFEIFRETARRNGLLTQAREFLMASGKWQAACYKHEIEAALRTPRLGGFQLLDLHDFPGQGTALVGVLDAFWDEKGYISAEEYSRFCGPIVPLARLPKMVWQNDETLSAHRGLKPVVQVIDDWFTNRKLGYVFEARIGEGRLIACAFDLEGDIEARPAARQLRASLFARAAAGDFEPPVSIEPQTLRTLLREP